MNYFFLFSAFFDSWPIALAQDIQSREPDASFSGLVAGKRRNYRRAAAAEDPGFDPLYNLADLEREWIETDYSRERLKKYRDRLGDEKLNRLVISCRHLAEGWISAADTMKTGLRTRSVDTEVIRRYTIGLLDFVDRALEECDPDLVFCYCVARPPAYALYEMCRLRGIPFRVLRETRVETQYIVDDNPFARYTPVVDTFEASFEEDVLDEDHLDRARRFLKDFRQQPEKPEYQRDQEVRGRAQGGNVPKLLERFRKFLFACVKTTVRGGERWELHEPTAFQRRYHQFMHEVNKLRLSGSKDFRWLSDLPENPFIYFPLHVEPEASTLVLSPYHTNQKAIVEMVGKKMPFDMNLAVKDHPSMMGKRPRGFYRDLRRMPKVELIHPMEDTFSLIQQSALTCVITGTAGWESMMLQQPTLILGENFPFFPIGQGFVHCSELMDLDAAIPEALGVEPASDDRLTRFIASIYTEGFPLPNDLYWSKVTMDDIRNNQPIADAIVNRLREAAHTKGVPAAT